MLDVHDLTKTYPGKGPGGHKRETVQALAGLDLRAEPGEFVAVHGPSGSGKSTLLLILGGMLSPTTGSVTFDGTDVYKMSQARRNRYRKHFVGFIFQKFYLLPYLTVMDNIRLPLALMGHTADADERVIETAERLGVAGRLGHRPSELSAGEQQRVAMARTLAADPALILADEPTGNLDKGNTEILASCLEEESARGRIVILATHDDVLIERSARCVQLEAGRIAAV